MHSPHLAPHRRRTCGLTLGAALTLALLAACGGGEGGHAGHQPERIDSGGLLALSEAGQPKVHLFDIDKGAVTHRLALASPASALAASPGGRYALAVQRAQHRVQVIDGGLWQEDHGDHLHDYRAAPRLLAGQIAGTRPTHYQNHGGIGALFMDGAADAGQPASVQVLTEPSVGQGAADSQISLPVAMHGTAEPRGRDFMLVSVRTDDAPGTLPNAVELHRRGSGGWALAQRFEARCPDLHGSHSNTAHSAFACSDGVLVISQSGEQFQARKLAYPPALPAGARVGTVTGHARLNTFIGLAAPGHLLEIDPVRGSITPMAWAEGRTRRAHSFDRTGQHFVLLDDQGTAHWLRADAQWRVAKTLPVVGDMPASAPFPTLVSSRSRDALFVTDVKAAQLVVLDSQTATVAQRVDLGFTPAAQTWLGIAAP